MLCRSSILFFNGDCINLELISLVYSGPQVFYQSDISSQAFSVPIMISSGPAKLFLFILSSTDLTLDFSIMGSSMLLCIVDFSSLLSWMNFPLYLYHCHNIQFFFCYACSYFTFYISCQRTYFLPCYFFYLLLYTCYLCVIFVSRMRNCQFDLFKLLFSSLLYKYYRQSVSIIAK